MKLLWNDIKLRLEKIGDFQSNLLFSALYYILFVPTSIFAKTHDYLNQRTQPKWDNFEDNYTTIQKIRKQ